MFSIFLALAVANFAVAYAKYRKGDKDGAKIYAQYTILALCVAAIAYSIFRLVMG
ncbi:MAG: hypothetical protein GDA50_00140 [Alphaproteobacteria bacterium GM202ARS2]|nr:hypothetical protein [Alphaproteobacteria bacterium GM202ARS2]